MKDYYKILEVNKEASSEIIAKVYKVLAKKYHPDLKDDANKSEAAEKFKEVSEAYEILSNEEKRKEYDKQLESEQQQNSIDIADYEVLKNYCIQLENELNELKNYNTPQNDSYNNYYQDTYSSTNYSQKTNEQQQQQAYNDAINKAYHDAYINNLRNLGYKIRYKKTFKENCKNLLALLITALIIYIIFKICWAIPSVKKYILSLFII